jgi:hypothetical protein
LRRGLNQTYETDEGKRVAAKRIVTKRIIDALVSGRWYLADGTFTFLSFAETMELIKWLFLRVDGQPPAAIDLTSDGSPVTLKVEYIDSPENTEDAE